MYFLSGWTVTVYVSLPVIRILTGAQPLAGASADEFMIHFAPYFACILVDRGDGGSGQLHVPSLHARRRELFGFICGR